MNENEYFDSNGHLTDAAFSALASGKQLDELTRLEMAEHLSFCDKCVESCVDATQSGELAEPDGSCLLGVRRGLRRIKRSNLVHRAATAALAAALALTLWLQVCLISTLERPAGFLTISTAGFQAFAIRSPALADR